jgi:glutamyl-tRNA synthetase
MTDEELFTRVKNFIGEGYDEAIVKMTIPLVKERMKKLSDYVPLCEFLFKQPETYEVDLSSKKEILSKTVEALSKIDDWLAAHIGEVMQKTAQELGVKNSEYFMVMRVAITGKKISPPLNESMEILGKEECVIRCEKAAS